MDIDIRNLEMELDKEFSGKLGLEEHTRSARYGSRIFGDNRFGGLNNPLTFCGFRCLFRYLNRLCTRDGALFTYSRLSGKHSPATETIVDLYELRSLDGNIRTKVYIDVFHPVETVCAPSGLRLRDESELSEEETVNLCLPVRQIIHSFTD